MKPEWKDCYMKFVKSNFNEFNIGDYIWHGRIGLEDDDFVLGPSIVGENETVINFSDVIIPISLFGDKIVWYKPVIQNIQIEKN